MGSAPFPSPGPAMSRLPIALALTVCVAAAAPGQPPAKTPAKPKKITEDVPGYTRTTIEGFTLLVSRGVAAADTAKLQRKPTEVLDLELKMIVRLLTPKAVALLRQLTLWVEWDEKTLLTNGRVGTAVAVYYGGHQLSMLAQGLHPGKAKTVSVMSMKSLAEEHQPGRDSGRCVLLHEMAHAVHDQLIGFDNADIKAAFRQAQERKLYDGAVYASTNDAEYFAELTCAYFDQLAYHPRTREELRKHDPTGFKLMETVWGKAARKPDPAAVAKARKGLGDTGADKFDLSLRYSDLMIGGRAGGPAGPDGLDGKVVLVAVWGTTDAAVLDRLAQAADELGGYGFAAVAGVGGRADAGRATAAFAARRADVTAAGRVAARVSKTSDNYTFQDPPHAFVFAADGQCVFRGSAYDALPHARAAVGRKLLAAGDKPDEPPAGLKPAADALTGGEPLTAAVPKLQAAAAGPDAATAAEAKTLLAALLGPGQEALAAAQAESKADPVAGFLLAEKVQAGYKNTPVGTKAAGVVLALKQLPAVAAEVRARQLLEPVRKLDGLLSGQLRGLEPTDALFRRANAGAIAELQAAVAPLRKKYPKTHAAAEAERIAKMYGVE